MAFRDLREFLQLLEAEGELLRVHREVDPGDEISSIVWETNSRRGPALFFEKVRGSAYPLVANVHGAYSRISLSSSMPRMARMRLRSRLRRLTRVAIQNT